MGKTFALDVDAADTVSDLKEELEACEGVFFGFRLAFHGRLGIPVALQRIVFSGKQLEEGFLGELGLVAGMVFIFASPVILS